MGLFLLVSGYELTVTLAVFIFLFFFYFPSFQLIEKFRDDRLGFVSFSH